MISILCTSPLHIMTAIAIKNEYYIDKEVSLILLDYSYNIGEMIPRIKKTNIFYNVYFIHAKDIFIKYNSRKSFMFYFLVNGKKIITQSGLELKKIDELLFPYRDPITTVIAKYLGDNCKYIYFDDGIASYVDPNVVICQHPSRIEHNVFSITDEYYNPKVGYFFSPELSEISIEKRKIEIPRSTDYIDIVNYVFGYENFPSRKVIVFDQCDNTTQDTGMDKDEVYSLISYIKKAFDIKDVYVKKHPKRTGVYYEAAGLDILPVKSGVPFEVCILNEKNINELVLVSDFSTASFMPGLLFDAKPRLIFLYHSMNFYKEKEKIEFDKFIKKFKMLYSEDDEITLVD